MSINPLDVDELDTFVSEEESLTKILADCDDALAAGTEPSTDDSLAHASADVRPKLERRLACLRLLNRLRPGFGERSALLMDQEDEENFADSSWRHGHPTRIGRFQIRRKLGQGGFGVVYLAFDPQLRRQVALKVPHPRTILTPELRERFGREAAAAAGLDHPNVVPVFDSGEAGPILYIASAYCPGISLSTWLKDKDRDEPNPARPTALLIAQIADGVQHAHERGILHRDLKPGNILLTPIRGGKAIEDSDTIELSSPPTDDPLGFLPRITDFGLAKRVGEWESDGGDAAEGEDPSAPLTRTGAVMGTPSYMSPEQAAGRTREVGPATDIHGLGVILYELLTGQTPFVAESTYDTLRRVQADEPLPPRKLRPKLPRDLEIICLKCLRKDPRRRYESAGAVAQDLRRFLEGKAILARSVGPVEQLWRWSVREPLVAGLLSTLAVVIVSAIIGLSWLWVSADHQAKLAVAGRNAAISAREKSEASLQQAQTLVEELTKVASRMSSQPTLANTRRDILEKVLAFHDSFLKEKGDDLAILYQSARAYLNVGHIRYELGRFEEARDAYIRSRDLLETLLQREPSQRKYRKTYAWSCFYIGYVDSTSLNLFTESIASYSKGLAVLKEMLAETPNDDDVLASMAIMLANWASATARVGDFVAAEQAVLEAIAIERDILKRAPNNSTMRISLGLGLDAQAALVRKKGNLNEAIVYAREALSEVRAVLKDPAASSNPNCERDFTRLANRLAGYLHEAGTPDLLKEAEALRRESLVTLKRIVETYPEVVEYRSHLASTAHTLARELPAARRDEANEFDRLALEHYVKLSTDLPKITRYQDVQADILNSIGTRLQNDRQAEAAESFRKAIEIQPKRPDPLNGLAWILLTSPDPKLLNYPKGLELAKQASELNPRSWGILNTLGVANYRVGDLAAAKAALEKSIEIRKRPDPTDEIFLAMTYWKLGERDRARVLYQSALRLIEGMKDPLAELARFRTEAEVLFNKPGPL